MKVTFDLELRKTHSEIVLYMQLLNLHPVLWTVYCFAALFTWMRFKKDLLITSMYRGDRTESLHAYNRAMDVDVDEKQAYGGLLPTEALELRDAINSTFEYDLARPDYKVCIYGENDVSNNHWNHLHFQVHPRTQNLRGVFLT